MIDPTQYKRVILLGPSHKVHMDFIGTTRSFNGWETPLGMIEIDQDVIKELTSEGGEELFQQIPNSHEEDEHSLEMHLPYIRKLFGT